MILFANADLKPRVSSLLILQSCIFPDCFAHETCVIRSFIVHATPWVKVLLQEKIRLTSWQIIWFCLIIFVSHARGWCIFLFKIWKESRAKTEALFIYLSFYLELAATAVSLDG